MARRVFFWLFDLRFLVQRKQEADNDVEGGLKEENLIYFRMSQNQYGVLEFKDGEEKLEGQ